MSHSQQTHSQQTHQQAYIEQGLPQDLIDYASNDQSAMMEALNYPNEPNEDNTIELDIMSEALKDYDKVYDEINWDYHDNILETEEEVIPPIDYVEEDEHGYYYEHYHNFSTPLALEINHHSGLEYITTLVLGFVLGVVVTLVFKL